ncbi:MAG: non-homologous end-joining DNA ligase [Candidatus Babeliaceae bacterium]|nr:non-homologous end-joining DNA ligase [Candidatus Babeliaceae bacterium]
MNIKKLNGHNIELSHEDKVYFPKSKITKGEVVNYYEKIAPYLLSYIHNRAITMKRFPEGIVGDFFYQKNAGAYFPDWIQLEKVTNKSEECNRAITSYVVCQNVATLVYIANQGCITPHMWLSKIAKINYPDVLIFDLDPAAQRVTNFKPIHDAAIMLKSILEACGLVPFVMTTGSRGLHVRVPIKPELTFDEVRAFAKVISEIIVDQDPKRFTVASRKEKRSNKLLIDIMRNSFGATAVVPYAVRAREHAPVATPLEWEELNDSKLRSDTYTIKTIFKRLEKKGDVWFKMQKHAYQLKNAIKALKKLYSSKIEKS